MTGRELGLAEWLSEQLDKDEVAADVALSGGPLVGEWRWARVSAQSTRFEACPVPPSRVLRDAQAIRKILDHYVSSIERDDTMKPSVGYSPLRAATSAYERSVRIIAEMYSDRQGYQQSWRP